MELSYANINKVGLINNDSKIFLHPKYGKCFDFNEINKYLFGITKNLVNVSNLDLLKRDIILCYNDNYLIKFDKLQEYVDHIKLITNFDKEKEYLPYNYYKIMDDDKPEFYSKIFKLFDDFKEYLLNSKKLNSDIIYKCIFDDKGNFKGYYKNSVMLDPFTASVIFKTAFNVITINIGENLEYKEPNTFNIDDTYNKKHFDKLYNFINNNYMMNNQEEYIIENLTNVVGNKSFATILYNSHKYKNNYVIPLEEAESLVLFKNNFNMKSYRREFLRLYKDKKLYDDEDEIIKLNFEGFNKYLLNLNKDNLVNFSQKESINELYFNITNELINSYQNLYNYLK